MVHTGPSRSRPAAGQSVDLHSSKGGDAPAGATTGAAPSRRRPPRTRPDLLVGLPVTGFFPSRVTLVSASPGRHTIRYRFRDGSLAIDATWIFTVAAS